MAATLANMMMGVSPASENAPNDTLTATAQEVSVLQKVDEMMQTSKALMESQQESFAAVTKALQDVAAQLAPSKAASAARQSCEAKQVGVHMVVERVFEMDTIKQVFGIQLFITMCWECPEFEEPPPPEEDDGDWEPKWTPKFRVRNLAEEIINRAQYNAVEIDGKKVIKGQIRQVLRLYEPLELGAFPYDCQDLNIVLESKMSVDQAEWLPPSEKYFGKVMKPASLLTDRVSLVDFELVTQMPYTYNLMRTTVEDRCVDAMQVSVKVRRKSNYYTLNVLFFMFCIISFAFLSWSLHPGDIEGRMGHDFTLILTAVAYKLVLTSMLPATSYITRLDIYILTGFLFLAGIAIVHAVLPHYVFTQLEMSALTAPPSSFAPGEEEELLDLDSRWMWGMGALWVSFNIIYIVTVKVLGYMEYQKFWNEAVIQQHECDKSIEMFGGQGKEEEPEVVI